MGMAGLAISGGGIRSATFGLGVLQALASLDLLKRFDYLSTVSGGGYIGSWFAAWIKREGDPANVEQQLHANRVAQARANRPYLDGRVVDEEPEPIYHLRSYSNYLTPRRGLLSADTWTVLAIYVRNTLLNLLTILPVTVALVLAVRLIVAFFGPTGDKILGRRETASVVAAVVSFLMLGLAFIAVSYEIFRIGQPRARLATRRGWDEFGSGLLHRWIVLPLLISAVLSCWLFAVPPRTIDPLGDAASLTQSQMEATKTRFPGPSPGDPRSFLARASEVALGFGILHVLAFVVLAILSVAVSDSPQRRGRQLSLRRRIRIIVKIALIGLGAGAIGGLLFYLFLNEGLWRWHHKPYMIATFGPPLVLLVGVAMAIFEVGLFGRDLDEGQREWWARLSALQMFYAVAWTIVFGIVLYGPALFAYLNSFKPAGSWSWVVPLVKSALGAGWLATAIGGAMAGRSARTIDKSDSWVADLLVVLAPPVFVGGLLAAVAQVVVFLYDQPVQYDHQPAQSLVAYWRAVCWADPGALYVGLVGGVAIAGLMMILVDANLFSLHSMYANRLVRCYLGASRKKETWAARARGDDGSTDRGDRRRRAGQEQPGGTWSPGRSGAPTGVPDPVRLENLVTGFDDRDDIALREFQIGRRSVPPGGRPYWGPYPLINTAMALIAGRELAWQDRKAESFVLTPNYCGSASTGYRRLSPGSDANLTLGRAVAISGAAADPNMGIHQSGPLTALMTIFNARLGWWIQNPRRFSRWRAAGPSYGVLLLKELFGRTDEFGRYVRLIDGGHFENMGLYELVRRRCRYIVAVDSGEDDAASSENLAHAVRMCRNDFGVRINIDTAHLEPKGEPALSHWHCAIGSIRYDDVDEDQIPGILVYLKLSLTGDEPTDVQNYASSHPGFPHESTVDQFFDEAQFESYRALGYHVASQVFADAVKEPFDIDIPPPGGGTPYQTYVEKANYAFMRENKILFSRIRRHWFPSPPEMGTSYREAVTECLDLEERLGSAAALQDLTCDLYPEIEQSRPAQGPPPQDAADPSGPLPHGSGAAQRAAELFAILRMTQTMEDVWSAMRLESLHENPTNAGWMSVFRRWTSAKAFRRSWPIVRGEFDREFVRFCEKELRLAIETKTTPLPPPAAGGSPGGEDQRVVESSLAELASEFRLEWPSEAGAGRGPRALWLDQAGRFREGWLIWSAPRSFPKEGYACGVILVYQVMPTVFELVVWIRGAFRCQGLGRAVLAKSWKDGAPQDRTFVDEICEWLKKDDRNPSDRDLTLRVRYPRSAAEGAAEMSRQEIWFNFFSYYDFSKLKRPRRSLPASGARPRDEILRGKIEEHLLRSGGTGPARRRAKNRARQSKAHLHGSGGTASDGILSGRIERIEDHVLRSGGAASEEVLSRKIEGGIHEDEIQRRKIEEHLLRTGADASDTGHLLRVEEIQDYVFRLGGAASDEILSRMIEDGVLRSGAAASDEILSRKIERWSPA